MLITAVKSRAGEKGLTLIEVLFALAVYGIIGALLLSSLALAARTNIISNELTTGETLARTQMEYVQSTVYASSYGNSPSLDKPDDYTVDTGVTYLDPNSLHQRIVVTVQRGSKTVYTLEDYKVNRVIEGS